MNDIRKAAARRISSSGRRRTVVTDPAPDTRIPIESDCEKNVAAIKGPKANVLDSCVGILKVRNGNDFSSKSKRSVDQGTASGSIVMQTLAMKRSTKQNFRAPLREKSEHDVLLMHTCNECLHFARLLSRENVPKHLIEASIRHKSFCAPSCTPPNIWEPWDDN